MVRDYASKEHSQFPYSQFSLDFYTTYYRVALNNVDLENYVLRINSKLSLVR